MTSVWVRQMNSPKGPYCFAPILGSSSSLSLQLDHPLRPGERIGNRVEGVLRKDVAAGHIEVAGERPERGDRLAERRNCTGHVDRDAPLNCSRLAFRVEARGCGYVFSGDHGDPLHLVKGVLIDLSPEGIPRRWSKIPCGRR